MDSSREDLKREFADKEYRDAYADDFLNTKIAIQLRVIREQRGLTQKDLAERIGTKQPGIARLENVNYASWNISTLKRIASDLDVRLNVSFETFGSLLDEDESFSRDWLQRPDFASDPAFKRASTAARAETHFCLDSNVLINALANAPLIMISNTLRVPSSVFIPGNHDATAAQTENEAEQLSNVADFAAAKERHDAFLGAQISTSLDANFQLARAI